MAPYRSQIGDIVAGYVLNGLDGQLREGDLLSMWVLDPALPSNRLLPLIWSRQTREVIAVHCAKAIQAWHMQVQNNQVGLQTMSGAQRFDAVGGFVNVKACIFEHGPDQFPSLGLIVGD